MAWPFHSEDSIRLEGRSRGRAQPEKASGALQRTIRISYHRKEFQIRKAVFRKAVVVLSCHMWWFGIR